MALKPDLPQRAVSRTTFGMIRRIAPALACLAMATCAVGADRAVEIAEIHVAALGGPERIAALTSYRSTGRLVVGATTAKLVVTAARPNRLRVETTYPDRVVVAGYDGTRAWQQQNGEAVQILAGPAADGLADAADFDDPLVAPDVCRCAVEFAGEVSVNDDRLFRLLVTRHLTKSYFVLLDERTYFLMQRVDLESGKPRMVTRYGDFRPMVGVLLPHHIVVEVPGQPARDALIDRIEPNPTVDTQTFRQP